MKWRCVFRNARDASHAKRLSAAEQSLVLARLLRWQLALAILWRSSAARSARRCSMPLRHLLLDAWRNLPLKRALSHGLTTRNVALQAQNGAAASLTPEPHQWLHLLCC